jgi:phage N-6-adenine-methyltransferase
MNAVHFSSRSDQWATPHWLFDLLDAEFGFALDVCALPQNAKCERYFSPEVDGLKQEWGGVCWMNPPYGREIGGWVEKAYTSSLAGTTVVCLIPARTDTDYWHRFVTKAHEIRFLKGRLRFGDAENSAPFPSALVIFRPGKHTQPRVRFVDLAEVRRTLFGC